MPGGYVSLREYARMRKAARLSGATHVAVHKAIVAGRLSRSVVRDAGGRLLGVRPSLADEEWTAGTDQTWQRTTFGTGRPAMPPRQEPLFDGGADAPGPDPAGQVGSGQSGALTYARARAVREGFLARLAQLEYQERTGALVSADDVRREAENAGREIRDAMLAAVQRVAPELVPLAGDERAMTDHLVHAVTDALNAHTRGATR